jgi:hypothetical protein
MSAEVQFSFFNNALDNDPKRRQLPWPEFVGFVELPRSIPKAPTPDLAKKLMPAISPATFKKGATRGVANVEELHLLFFDFDNSAVTATVNPKTGRPKRGKGRIDNPVRPEEVTLHLAAAGVGHLVHDTWSNTRDWPHFRLIIPLSKPVLPENWDTTTAWIIQHLGLGPYMRGVDLPVLKDTARLYFLPGGRHVR